MPLLTEEQLFRSMAGLTRPKSKDYILHLNLALCEFDITEPLAQAHFLGQLAHESGDLKFWQEIWGPTNAQLRYERDFTQEWRAGLPKEHCNRKAFELGNAEHGDGFRFAGHGPIQVTGRSNHKRMAEKLNIDCVNNPLLLAQPDYGFRAAALFWKDHGLTEMARRNEIIAITKRINGGLNGLEDRKLRVAKAKRALGVSDA